MKQPQRQTIFNASHFGVCKSMYGQTFECVHCIHGRTFTHTHTYSVGHKFGKCENVHKAHKKKINAWFLINCMNKLQNYFVIVTYTHRSSRTPTH